MIGPLVVSVCFACMLVACTLGNVLATSAADHPEAHFGSWASRPGPDPEPRPATCHWTRPADGRNAPISRATRSPQAVRSPPMCRRPGLTPTDP